MATRLAGSRKPLLRRRHPESIRHPKGIARAGSATFPRSPRISDGTASARSSDRGVNAVLREPRIIAVAGNRGHLWGEQHRIETRTKPNHSRVNSGRLTIGGNYSRSPIEVSGTRPESDQAEHVHAAVHDRRPSSFEERPPGPQDDRRGQSEFNPVGYARREKIVQAESGN